MKVTVDADPVIKDLTGLELAIGTRQGLNKLGRKCEQYMRNAVTQAFSSGIEPDTGRPWARRKGNQSNAMLNKTGELRRWVLTESKAWVGKHASRLYLKFGLPDDKRAIIKGGSLFWGRKQARKGTGSRVGGRPKTGYMTGRPYMGLTSSAKRRVEQAAKQHIKV